MQVAMTERDKKLIVMLAIIVIVVSIGYWGIRPSLIAMKEANEDITEQEEIKQLNDMKLAQIPVLEERSEELKKDIDAKKVEYLPLMNSDELDKMFTGMVLERGLFAYDLDIGIESVPLSLDPYAYSKMATDPFYGYEEEDTEEGAVEEADADLNTEKGMLAALESEVAGDEDEDLEGANYNDVIYRAHLILRIGGDLDTLLKFVDDIEAYEKKILITGYRWNESTAIAGDEDEGGEEEAVAEIEEAEEEEAEAEEDDKNEDSEETAEEVAGNAAEPAADADYIIASERILTLELDVLMFDDFGNQEE